MPGRGSPGAEGVRRTGRGGGGGGGSAAPDAGAESVDADPEAAARAICLRQLTVAPRTRAQLAETLRRRGVPDDAASAALDRLAEVGLVDDTAFAEGWVRSRHAGRGLARRALAHELRGRGVADDVVAQAVDEVSRDDELAAARTLVAHRVHATAGLPYETRVRRLAGLLARKGYPTGMALTVVREALQRGGVRDPDVVEGGGAWGKDESLQ